MNHYHIQPATWYQTYAEIRNIKHQKVSPNGNKLKDCKRSEINMEDER